MKSLVGSLVSENKKLFWKEVKKVRGGEGQEEREGVRALRKTGRRRRRRRKARRRSTQRESEFGERKEERAGSFKHLS